MDTIGKTIVEDSFGRRFSYLRLSLTDICNFKCSYCLPDGYKGNKRDSFLSVDEIRRLVTSFSELGLQKVRLTGGEPTVRKDFIEIVETIKLLPSVKKLALTTNGYKLEQRAADYLKAGITDINISIDSLKPESFYKITGHNILDSVLKGVHKCLDIGFSSVKINTVLLKGLNDNDLIHFLDFIKNKPISLRFIELMRTGDNKNYFESHHLSAETITDRIMKDGWQKSRRSLFDGPAQEFVKENYLGKIGIIAPYSKDFCATCNRLRVSAKGDLMLCLFGESGYSIREFLQNDNQSEILKDRIINTLRFKKISHFLDEDKTGVTKNLSVIGG